MFRVGASSAGTAPGAHGEELRRLALALSLSLLFHAILLWAEPARAPLGSATTKDMALKARLVAGREVRPEAVERMIPAPAGVSVAATEASVAEPLSPPPSRDAVVRPVLPPYEAGQPPSASAHPESDAASAAEPLAAPPSVERAGAFQVPLPGQPEFLPARMLDLMPRPAEPVALVYPEAVAMGRSGMVALLLLIDEAGVVVDAKVVESDPPGVFDDFAVEVFRATRFLPGERDGRPVRSRLVVEMSFDANPQSRRAP